MNPEIVQQQPQEELRQAFLVAYLLVRFRLLEEACVFIDSNVQANLIAEAEEEFEAYECGDLAHEFLPRRIVIDHKDERFCTDEYVCTGHLTYRLNGMDSYHVEGKTLILGTQFNEGGLVRFHVCIDRKENQSTFFMSVPFYERRNKP